MNANFSSTTLKDNEPRQTENDSLEVLIQMYRKEQEELKYKSEGNGLNEANHISLKSQNWLLEILMVSIGIFLILCYATWKDQRTTDANELYRDTMVMKDFILNQVLQAP